MLKFVAIVGVASVGILVIFLHSIYQTCTAMAHVVSEAAEFDADEDYTPEDDEIAELEVWYRK